MSSAPISPRGSRKRLGMAERRDSVLDTVQPVIERMAHLLATEPDRYSTDERLEFSVRHVGWWMTGRTALAP